MTRHRPSTILLLDHSLLPTAVFLRQFGWFIVSRRCITRQLAGPKKPPAPPASTSNRKKPRCVRADTAALRQIRKFQTTTDLLIPKHQLQPRVRELMGAATIGSAELLRIQSTGLMARCRKQLRHVSSVCSSKQICAIHARSVTVMSTDMQPALRLLRGPQRWIASALFHPCRSLW